ncbi:MAG: sigma-70 family RNA polymerase sigma factor [Planctomycetia bacterium]|nr:sigma-70 family RNA polymerase sigma factor [Planctomycetia bacterium]
MASDASDQLLEHFAKGDLASAHQLLGSYRERLKHMVSIHLDRRLAARFDPSDVVQEGLAEAARRLPDYVAERPVALYPWLRQLTWEKLLQMRQHQLAARKRDPRREQSLALTDESAMQLAERLVSTGTSPSEGLIKRELGQRVRAALAQLSAGDQEILSMRYLEQLTVDEATAVLGISTDTFMKRHWRAMQRLRPFLDG